MRLILAQTPRFNSYVEGVKWLLGELPRGDVLVLPEYWTGTAPMDGGEFRRYVEALAEVAAAFGGVVVGGAVAVERGGG